MPESDEIDKAYAELAKDERENSDKIRERRDRLRKEGRLDPWGD